jgi:glycosyltransferase involved in cell wall biosynthesis
MSEITAQPPRLTIVIPTVNRAALVGRAVESALGQTYPSIEVLVSNNGSIDDTRRVLDRFAGRPRLTVLHRDVTVPATEHGNFLVDLARGEFFLGLSDDDWLEPEFAEKIMALFDRHPDLSFAWTGCWIHYADAVLPAATGPEVERGSKFLAAFLAGERNICWCACVTRTTDLRRIGPIPPDVICGDMFYWTKLAAQGPVGCVAQALSHYVNYRDDGEGSSVATPVLSWAVDTQRWVTDILVTCERDGADAAPYAELEWNARRFVARSVANQFVWCALRGAGRRDLLKSIADAAPYLRSEDRSPWIRVIAGILAPRWLLRRRMIAEARRRARAANRQARVRT